MGTESPDIATVSDGWKNYVGDTLREKLGRSPDRADAVAYLYTGVRQLEAYERWNYDGPIVLWPLPPDADETVEPTSADERRRLHDEELHRLIWRDVEDDREWSASTSWDAVEELFRRCGLQSE